MLARYAHCVCVHVRVPVCTLIPSHVYIYTHTYLHLYLFLYVENYGFILIYLISVKHCLLILVFSLPFFDRDKLSFHYLSYTYLFTSLPVCNQFVIVLAVTLTSMQIPFSLLSGSNILQTTTSPEFWHPPYVTFLCSLFHPAWFWDWCQAILSPRSPLLRFGLLYHLSQALQWWLWDPLWLTLTEPLYPTWALTLHTCCPLCSPLWTPFLSYLDSDSHARPVSNTLCLANLLFSHLIVHFALHYLVVLVLNYLEEEEDLLLVKTKIVFITVCHNRFVRSFDFLL